MCRAATGRLSFAKLLVEVDAKRDLPDNLVVLIPGDDGSRAVEVNLKVEYPWRPSWCSKCVKFGHSIHECPVIVAAKILENQSKKNDIMGDPEIVGSERDFNVVQHRGKEKMMDSSRQGQKYKNGGSVGLNNQFWYVNKGLVIKDVENQGWNKVNHKYVTYAKNNGSSVSHGMHNKFSMLDSEFGEDLVEEISIQNASRVQDGGPYGVKNKGLLPTPGVDKQFLGPYIPVNIKEMSEVQQGVSKDQGGYQDQSMLDLLNARVIEYIYSGSNIS
ncbi:hypothetical protein AgCh_028725 [Apium graveolens]